MSRYRNKAAPALHQTARQEQSLAEAMAPVRVLDFVWFTGKVECGFDLGRQNHLQSLLLEAVHAGILGRFDLLPIKAVDHAEKGTAIFEGLGWDGLGKAEILRLEAFLAWVRYDHRIVGGPEEPGLEIALISSALPTRDSQVRRNVLTRAEVF